MTQDFSSLLDSSLVLFDGGLGTTLADCIGLDISHSPLWSAQPIVHSSEAILKAHLLFLRAGARIISTSTYQCSFETFKTAGYDSDQAKEFMLESVRIANSAKSIYLEELKRDGHALSKSPLIALSLGPYGATLTPTQEFRGLYPPPYGPREYSDTHTNTNAFDQDDSQGDDKAIVALTEFHHTRLMVFASKPEIWEKIDFIALETIPLKREVTAIRNAIQLLHDDLAKEGRGQEVKPWWISCVFPEGQSPGETFPGGPKMQIDDLLTTAFTDGTSESNNSPPSVPSGFGINCTKPQYLPALTASMGRFMKALPLEHKPWLIIYPNGNDTYDEETRTWVGTSESERHWAEELAGLVNGLLEGESHGFGGVIVGGCCKTGPNHISALHSMLCHELLILEKLKRDNIFNF